MVLSSGHAPRFQRYLKHASPFTLSVISERFGIPSPPEVPLDWMSFWRECTGNFCIYRGAYGTQAWARDDPMPMLGARVETVSELSLGG